MKRLAYYYWLRLRRTGKRLARAKASAHSIALGAAIGVFWGCSPLLGLHMLGAALLATVFRASRIAAIATVWISNPLTFLPLYGFTYWLGHKLTGREPGWADYVQVLHRVEGISKNNGFFPGMREGLREFGSLGPEALENLLLGCVTGGFLAAVATYLPTRLLIERVRAARGRRHLPGRGDATRRSGG